MSSDGERLIAKAKRKLQDLEEEVVKTKEFINQILEFEGREPIYLDAQSELTRRAGQE